MLKKLLLALLAVGLVSAARADQPRDEKAAKEQAALQKEIADLSALLERVTQEAAAAREEAIRQKERAEEARAAALQQADEALQKAKQARDQEAARRKEAEAAVAKALVEAEKLRALQNAGQKTEPPPPDKTKAKKKARKVETLKSLSEEVARLKAEVAKIRDEMTTGTEKARRAAADERDRAKAAEVDGKAIVEKARREVEEYAALARKVKEEAADALQREAVARKNAEATISKLQDELTATKQMHEEVVRKYEKLIDALKEELKRATKKEEK